MQKKWVALIPAYEPDKNFIELLRKVRLAGFEAVVVDDGSGNAFSKLFRQASVFSIVLTHIENKGKGCALKTGFSYIDKHYPDGCVIDVYKRQTFAISLSGRI